MRIALGIDVGATHYRSVLINAACETLWSHFDRTPADREQIVPRLQETIREALRNYPELGGVGIGIAGTVHHGVVDSTNLSMSCVPLREALQFPDLPIVIENDINAAVVGEQAFGAARGMENAILLTVSTGIGAGILIGGNLYRGAHGTAGEVGHEVMDLNGLLCGCGRRGCWEMIGSGTAHRRRIYEAFGAGTWPNLAAAPTPEEVTVRARTGDRAAMALIRRTARYLAIGIGNLFNSYDPEAVLLTGGFARNNWDLIYPFILSEVQEQVASPQVNLRLGELEDSAGAIGAAWLVLA